MTADNQPTGYVASASNFNTVYPAWEAFDGSPGVSDPTTRWQPNNTFASAGVYRYTDPGSGPWVPTTSFTDNITTIANGSTIRGDWLQLESPDKVNVKSYRIYNSTDYVTDYNAHTVVLLGSNTGDDDWVYVSSGERELSWSNTTSTTSGNHVSTVAIENTSENMGFYRYHRLIVTKVTDQHIPVILQLELFGVPEYDPEADGTDVTLKSLANVPNTDWLEVYYDAKGLTPGAVTSVSDLKPSSLGTALNSSSTNNITVTDDAFVFNGTDSYIKIDDLTNPSGAWVHSVVAWINPSDLGGNFDLTWIGDADSATTRQSFTFNTSVQVTMGINGSNVQFGLVPPLTKNKWHHVVYTFNGGAAGSDSTAYKVFVDGVEAYKTTGVGSGTLTLPAQTALWIGRNHGGSNYFNGKIANLRLFNRALTTDEIYQLYAYQKEYFGHGDLSMTLKAGRLGIGTSEPRAALDVRGDVHISGSLRKTRAQMFANTSGSMNTDNANWVELIPYGEIWTAYSENPLFSVSITGDYTDTTGRKVFFRLLVRNERTREVVYFPDSSGWRKYIYVDHSRLDGHGYHGIMSNLTPGDSYTCKLEVNGNHASSYYTWHSQYGPITGIVWD